MDNGVRVGEHAIGGGIYCFVSSECPRVRSLIELVGFISEVMSA